MKRTSSWTVEDEGIRPAGRPDRCFYCGEPKGGVHKEGCVIRSKTVVVRFSVDLVMAVPEDWTEGDIHFRYNEGTWCADNLVDMLGEAAKRAENGNGCLCYATDAKYLREADATDEYGQHLFAEMLPS